MVAPVEITIEEGPGGKVHISEAEYTSEGFEIGGLNPLNTYPAGIACHYTGHKPAIETGWPHKQFYGSYIKPGRYDGDPATVPAEVNLTVNPVVNNVDGAVTGYKYFNFDLLDPSQAAELQLTLRPTGVKGAIEILAGDIYRDPVKLGEIELGEAVGDTVTLTAPLENTDRLRGKMPLYFRVRASGPDASVADLLYFRFNQ